MKICDSGRLLFAVVVFAACFLRCGELSPSSGTSGRPRVLDEQLLRQWNEVNGYYRLSLAQDSSYRYTNLKPYAVTFPEDTVWFPDTIGTWYTIQPFDSVINDTLTYFEGGCKLHLVGRNGRTATTFYFFTSETLSVCKSLGCLKFLGSLQ